MNKHKSNKIKENSNTVRHLIMGQITTTQNLVAIKEVRHAGQRKSNTAVVGRSDMKIEYSEESEQRCRSSNYSTDMLNFVLICICIS